MFRRILSRSVIPNGLLPKAYSVALPLQTRMYCVTADQLFERSCYNKIDYKIHQTAPVQEAVIRFSAFDVGCLAVVNDDEKLVGIFSEGDFIKRVASVGKDASQVQIQEVCTLVPNILVAASNDSLEECMSKMHFKNIRHLAIVDQDRLNGLISIKDLFRETIVQDRKLITRLTDFYIGKGAFFGSE